MSRLALYGVALAAFLLAGWSYGHYRYKAGEGAAEARMALDVAKANRKAAETEKTAQDRVDLLEKENAEKLSDLDTRLAAALARTPPVRVCPPARSRELPKTSSDPAEYRDDTSRDRPDSEDGRDIAPELLAYARDAERFRLALIACKAYGAEIERFRAASAAPP